MAVSKMKVQLIFPKHDAGVNLKDNYGYLVLPTGLEVIASVLERDNRGTEIEIFTGYMNTEQEIIKKLDGDMVGVTDWVTNHKTATKFLKKAKEKGAITIVGGQNASNLGQRILKNCDFVDYVIFGSGEYAFSKLVSGEDPKNIENLWYRDKNKIKFTFLKEVNLNTLPLFDFKHVIGFNPKKYVKDLAKRSAGEQVAVSFIRGCAKACKSGRCTFCSLPLIGVRVMDPKKAWKQLVYLNKLYKIDFFQESGDSFNTGSYPQLLAATKPSNLKLKFRGNCTLPLTKKDVKIFKELGFVEFLMGLDHVDEKILKEINVERRSNKEIEKSIELLKENKINVKLSCMFGLPGETEETVRKLCEYVKFLTDKYGVVIHLSWAQPTVGSQLFEKLIKKKKLVKEYNKLNKGDLLNDDIINYELLIKLMVKYFTKISYKKIIEIVREITSYKPRLQF